jgi:hypothetical protein
MLATGGGCMSARTISAVESAVAREFAGADLGDARRVRRLLSIAEAFGAKPSESIPRIARDAAELEATYRFLSNSAFGFPEVIAPHFKATAERANKFDNTLAVHDGSEFTYSLDEDHPRSGLAHMGNRQGFHAVPCLAIAADGSNRPLGILGCQWWVEGTTEDKGEGKQRRATSSGGIDGRTWIECIEESEALADGKTRLIHVIDREGGSYNVFAHLTGKNRGFAIRVKSDRLVEFAANSGDLINIREAAARSKNEYEVTVPLSRRKKSKFKSQKNPPREARKARLAFAAAPVRLKRPVSAPRETPDYLSINLVFVKELDTPEGEEPVEWFIATTEPIDTPEAIVRIVNFYRARWTIEDFFKAVKTGCAFEKRQLESLDALIKLFAISLVVAWRSLLLRQESRRQPDQPATAALTEIHILVLRETSPIPLGPEPTVRQALLAVAALGGHVKNNGDPGFLVLRRGLQCLEERVTGFLAMLAILRPTEK